MTDPAAHSNRALTRVLALGVFLFAGLVAAGTYLRTGSPVPGAIVLGAAAVFLGLWYATGHRLAHRAAVGGASGEGTRVLCLVAFLFAVLAWGLALAGDFIAVQSTRVALWLLVSTAGTCLVAFVAAVIGLSHPAQRSGKVFGVLAIVAVAGLVLFAIARAALRL